MMQCYVVRNDTELYVLTEDTGEREVRGSMMQCYVVNNDTELYVLTEDTGERGEGEYDVVLCCKE